MLHLTGYRFDQNEVVANHSRLLEETLLNNNDGVSLLALINDELALINDDQIT
ncbi:MAG: hypothetical protein ACRYE9_04390 [Janthinobacterium lividum]